MTTNHLKLIFAIITATVEAIEAFQKARGTK
jgi:hypothetical protein